jgi:peptide subunit release factor 1 (eRF1)
MMKTRKKRTSRCPSCGEMISVGERPKIGQYLLCSICDEKVEVVNLDPIILDLIYVQDENGYTIDEYEFWDKYWAEV